MKMMTYTVSSGSTKRYNSAAATREHHPTSLIAEQTAGFGLFAREMVFACHAALADHLPLVMTSGVIAGLFAMATSFGISYRGGL